jgi:hypothetical protein
MKAKYTAKITADEMKLMSKTSKVTWMDCERKEDVGLLKEQKPSYIGQSFEI